MFLKLYSSNNCTAARNSPARIIDIGIMFNSRDSDRKIVFNHLFKSFRCKSHGISALLYTHWDLVLKNSYGIEVCIILIVSLVTLKMSTWPLNSANFVHYYNPR